MQNRQIVLDTETTGLDVGAGHRVIEIGAVEIGARRLTGEYRHYYLRPDRSVDPEARAVHGISDEFLADKPRFTDVVDDFLTFIEGAELIIHNAPFDVGFLDHELNRSGRCMTLEQCCTITDTLLEARRRHPGQRNSLDALCKRYGVDNSKRDRHGALLDAEILAHVYLAMTGGQLGLGLDQSQTTSHTADLRRTSESNAVGWRSTARRRGLRIIRADAAEQAAHRRFVELLEARSGQSIHWPDPEACTE